MTSGLTYTEARNAIEWVDLRAGRSAVTVPINCVSIMGQDNREPCKKDGLIDSILHISKT